MLYAVAIRRLFRLQARGMRLGIDRMREGLAFRGLEPSGLPPIIQVAGTNGKGSVSAMLASALSAAGYRTGLFSSPHLHRFTERIRIDGEPLDTREATRRIGELLAVFGRRGAPFMSFFELSTLMAAEVFRDHGCDVAVMEVGLGGRLDATTALPAMLSVITRIARDHEKVLGSQLSQIAREKAGIIRPGIPVIVGSREPAALSAIERVARRKRAPLRRIDREFASQGTGRRARFRTGAKRFGPLRLGLAGDHQVDNAACAIAALAELRKLGWSVSDRAIVGGLESTRWPARLEHVPGAPDVLLDAAHNPDGCAALAAYLASLPRRPRALVFGVMRDKNYAEMLRTLAPEVDAVFYARPRLPRAEHPRALQRIVRGTVARSVGEALRMARRSAGPDGLVVVAGSIFLVAEARAKILRVPADPLIRL